MNTTSPYVLPEIELIYRPKVRLSSLPKVESPDSAYLFFLETWDESKICFIEQFKIMYLSRANRVLGIYTLSTGGTSSTVIDIKLMFVGALKANAAFIIIAHNHPSGEITPSERDIALTKQINEVGKLLDLPLIDHLIVSPYQYTSLKSELLF